MPKKKPAVLPNEEFIKYLGEHAGKTAKYIEAEFGECLENSEDWRDMHAWLTYAHREWEARYKGKPVE